MMFGEGLSKIGDLLDLGTNLNLVNKSGAWFSYGEMRLGQGRDKAKECLAAHPEICHEIENAARRHYGMKELEALALPENFIQVDHEALAKETGDDLLNIELVDDDSELEEIDALVIEGDIEGDY
jgi:hypothetical protein